MKIIAWYLPQFHNIPENDEWWGDGFTEWTTVKKAKPLFEKHEQPKVPLDNNYYNLLDDNVKIWQVNIAKKYGIYGFGYYHYWFNGKMLLEKPMEQMLVNKSVNLPFCICWVNTQWTKSWVGKKNEILIPQTYGDKEEWERHFYYLLPFFKDERYICEEGKPIFIIYKPKAIPKINEMLELWTKLAIKEGLKGIYYVGRVASVDDKSGDCAIFDRVVEWSPRYAFSLLKQRNVFIKYLARIKSKIFYIIEKAIGIDLNSIILYNDIMKSVSGNIELIDYDKAWNILIDSPPFSKSSYPGAFVNWDNTARYGDKGSIVVSVTPEKFKAYLKKYILKVKNEYKCDKIFMFAWNEWAESGYLEPDEKYGYAYIEALRDALIETNEFPYKK